jgi:hypothetical protein
MSLKALLPNKNRYGKAMHGTLAPFASLALALEVGRCTSSTRMVIGNK